MTAPVMGADPNFKVRLGTRSSSPHLGICWASREAHKCCTQLLPHCTLAIVGARVELTDSLFTVRASVLHNPVAWKHV